jgi:hypothetical protein
MLPFILLAVSAAPCEPVNGLMPLLKPGSVLFIGEIHGTNESPAFVGRAACLASGGNHSVTVALEIPKSESARFERYLHSTGRQADRDALLAGPFWTDSFQDGRRSKAMLALIDDLRMLKTVRVVLIDEPDATSAKRDRDAVMADNLQTAVELAPDDIFIVLTGNQHSRLAGTSMAQLFVRGMPRVNVSSLDVAFTNGSAWTCVSGDAADCGPHSLRGSGDGRGGRVEHGVYDVGTITASEPAVRRR